METNPSYSVRAMARSFGVSPGFLSQVMNGRKKLSLERAVQFSQVLKLSNSASSALLRAVTLDLATSGSRARSMMENIIVDSTETGEYKFIEVERFKVLSQWYHLAILDLSETEGFRAESRWIARRLKISPVQAANALERLKTLGLLVKKDGAWKKSDTRVAFASSQSHASIREHHKQMIEKGLECLSDASRSAFEKRSITGITLSINPKHLPEAFEMIDQFRKTLESRLSRGQCSEVYQLNVQLFNLSHPLPNKESDS
jgi:uncharacterized protein (TIGR02147 family)